MADFFAVCDHGRAVEATARACDPALTAVFAASVDQRVAAGRAWLEHARRGDWHSFEQPLQRLGLSCARAGIALTAWGEIASAFYREIVAGAVDAHAARPAQLAQVLLVLGELLERTHTVIAAAYDAAGREHAEPPQLAPVPDRATPRPEGAIEAASERAFAMRLQILSTTAHEFAASSGDISLLLELVARRLGEILGEGCAVRLVSDDGVWLEPSASFYHPDPDRREFARQLLGTRRQRIGEGLAGRAAATGEAVLVPEVNASQMVALSAPAFGSLWSRVNITSALAIPLRANGRIIGAISLMRTTAGHPYTIDDQHLAQELADRAGLAIDKAVLVATLEQRVAERTAALAATNRELETFSYSVSHDLRTPLRAIDGFSRALLADYGAVLDATAQRYLSRICDATKRMSNLIDDLLNLARVTRQLPTFVELDLSALASEIITEIQLRDPTRDVVVHIQPTVSAWADARMLRIVLENLLGNAWKFTSKHAGAEIWFGADATAFHVRDTGAGFDMAYAEKLFVPFQRLHTTKEYDGTGVGLATVQRIIGLHGGRIWVEAEIDKGATFRFTLGDHHQPAQG
jgi:signal transduction histidine kinase